MENEKINPKKGAIALGHRLGVTQVRMLARVLLEVEMQGLETGALSMCIGTGMRRR